MELMDEIWVPSAWGADRFVASGVDRAKVFVVPGGYCCCYLQLIAYYIIICYFFSMIDDLTAGLNIEIEQRTMRTTWEKSGGVLAHVLFVVSADIVEAIDTSQFDPEMVPRNRSLLPGAVLARTLANLNR